MEILGLIAVLTGLFGALACGAYGFYVHFISHDYEVPINLLTSFAMGVGCTFITIVLFYGATAMILILYSIIKDSVR